MKENEKKVEEKRMKGLKREENWVYNKIYKR